MRNLNFHADHSRYTIAEDESGHTVTVYDWTGEGYEPREPKPVILCEFLRDLWKHAEAGYPTYA